MKFCTQCGSELKGEVNNFCLNCGHKLTKEEQIEPVEEIEPGEKKVEEKPEEKIEETDETKDVPSFISVKKIEEEKEVPEWKPVEEEIAEPIGEKEDEPEPVEETIEKTVIEEKIEEETKLEEWKEIETEEVEPEIKEETEEQVVEPSEKEQVKEKTDFIVKDELEAFKEIKCIDEQTADVLYKHGLNSIEDLRIITLGDLREINGVTKKLAKQIKKEIKELDKKRYIENGYSEYIISDDFEKNKKEVTEEPETEEFFEPVSEETDEENVFKEITAIDNNTSKLLIENGITSIEILRETTISDLTNIRGIRRKLAKQIKKELGTIPKRSIKIKRRKKQEKTDMLDEEEDLAEWEYFDDEEKPKTKKGYHHGDYTLYEKKITMKGGKKRTVRFFSKAEPDEGKPINLPKGYEVKVNKKTTVPYLKKKK